MDTTLQSIIEIALQQGIWAALSFTGIGHHRPKVRGWLRSANASVGCR